MQHFWVGRDQIDAPCEHEPVPSLALGRVDGVLLEAQGDLREKLLHGGQDVHRGGVLDIDEWVPGGPRVLAVVEVHHLGTRRVTRC